MNEENTNEFIGTCVVAECVDAAIHVENGFCKGLPVMNGLQSGHLLFITLNQICQLVQEHLKNNMWLLTNERGSYCGATYTLYISLPRREASIVRQSDPVLKASSAAQTARSTSA